MKLERVFDDLGEFVSCYKGAISGEGMLHVAASHWPLGTTLKVDLRLEDGLVLVRGLATVVRIELAPEGATGWLVALRFLDLDRASRDFLDRLEKRSEAEGVDPFRLANPGTRPPTSLKRPAHRPTQPPRTSSLSFEPPLLDRAPATALEPEHQPHPSLQVEASPAPEFVGASPATPSRQTSQATASTTVTQGEPVDDAADVPLEAERDDSETRDAVSEGRPAAHGRRRAASGPIEPDRSSRLRWLLWAAALAAVAILAVTLTWLLVPELFSPDVGTPVVVSEPYPAEHSRDEVPLEGVPDDGPGDESPHNEDPVPPSTTAVPAPQAPATRTAVPTPAAATPAPTAVVTTLAPGPLHVVALEWTEDEDGTTVVLVADRPLDAGRLRGGRLDGSPGPRELVRILDVASSTLAIATPVAGRDLETVRTWLHSDRRPPELHVVLDLADPMVRAAPPEVVGNRLVLRLAR